MSALRTLKPLMDRVLVRKLAAQAKSAGGLVLPKSAQKELHEGVVVATGPGLDIGGGSVVPVNVKEGDQVLLPEYGGHKVDLGGDEEHVLYKSEEILGILGHAKSS